MKSKSRKKKKLVKSRKARRTRGHKITSKRSPAKAANSQRLWTPRNKRVELTTQKALTAINLMKREHRSLSQATRAAHIKASTFIKYAGRGIHRTGPGKRWKLAKNDPLALPMTVLTPLGPVTALVRGSRERIRLGHYDNALRRWRRGLAGAEKELKAFEGQIVAGHVLMTDVELLARLEEFGKLDFEVLYVSSAGGK